MSIRELPVCLAFLALMCGDLAAVEGPPAKEKNPRPAPRLVARTAQIELHYARRSLPAKGRRSVRRERDLVRSLDAEWRSRVAVAFGKIVLPPGSYRLGVEAREKSRLELVFRKKVTGKNSTGKKAGEKKVDGKKSTGKKAPPKNGQSARAPVSRRGAGAAPAAGVAKPAGEGPRKAGGRSKKKPGKKLEGEVQPAVLLRVPLRERPLKERGQHLEVELRPVSRGRKVQIILRVGGGEYRAQLRVLSSPPGKARKVPEESAEPPAKKTAGAD